MEQHPSAFALDALHAGAGDAETAAHAAACDACTRYLAELDADQRRFLERGSPETFVRDVRARADALDAGRRRRWLGGGLAAGLAAAAAAVVVVVTQPGAPPADTLRLKGDAVLEVVRLRGDAQAVLGGPSVSVRPGDRVRVRLTVPEARVLSVAVLDDAGRFTPVAQAQTFAAGQHLLEATFAVDDQPMRARLIAGSPDAVQRARETGTLHDVVTLALLSPGSGP